MPSQPPKNLLISAGLLAVLIVLVAGVAALTKREDSLATSDQEQLSDTVTDATPTPTAAVSDVPTGSPETEEIVTTPVATPTPATPTPTPKVAGYKDGTYTAAGTYGTPGGIEQIGVTITLANGVITASSVTQQPTNHDSREFQSAFVSGYKQYVIGKSIDSVNLSRVSGSSLTPNGFNNALASIKSQAKS